MDTKSFLKEIRSIIREEIEYALDKKLTEQKKVNVQKSVNHGISLFKEAQKSNGVQKQKVQQKPPQKSPNTKSSAIQALLEETRRSLQESYSDDDYGDDRTLSFDTNSLNAFATERYPTINAIPAGVDPDQLAPEVSKALTRDYSALMARINEKKGV
jgi:hypothetical protein